MKKPGMHASVEVVPVLAAIHSCATAVTHTNKKKLAACPRARASKYHKKRQRENDTLPSSDGRPTARQTLGNAPSVSKNYLALHVTHNIEERVTNTRVQIICIYMIAHLEKRAAVSDDDVPPPDPPAGTPRRRLCPG